MVTSAPGGELRTIIRFFTLLQPMSKLRVTSIRMDGKFSIFKMRRKM
jgi:hypothetical protein